MNNIMMKKGLTSEQLAIVQSEYNKKEKSKLTMYLLWWFTGVLGGHRYYLGDIGYAIAMTLTLGGLGFWALIDVFFIGSRRDEINEQLENEIIQNVKIYTKEDNTKKEVVQA